MSVFILAIAIINFLQKIVRISPNMRVYKCVNSTFFMQPPSKGDRQIFIHMGVRQKNGCIHFWEPIILHGGAIYFAI